LMSVVHENGEL